MSFRGGKRFREEESEGPGLSRGGRGGRGGGGGDSDRRIPKKAHVESRNKSGGTFRRDESPPSGNSYETPKIQRELFVGNIVSPEATEDDLREFLTDAMKSSGLIPRNARDPISDCRITMKYGFIVFYTSEDATKALNMNNIPYRGAPLKLKRPAKYVGPLMEGMTWQELTGQSNDSGGGGGGGRYSSRAPRQHHQQREQPQQDYQQQQVAAPISRGPEYHLTRAYREVFVGSLPSDISDSDLCEFLGAVLLKMGMSNSGEENPIMEVKLNPVNHFAFCIMRTVEDAANILNLNGLPFRENRIKLERPARFDGGQAGVSFFNWEELFSSWLNGELKMMTAGNPTRVLRVSNIASYQELLDPTYYLDLMEDTRAEVTRHAPSAVLRSVIVPRPSQVSSGTLFQDRDIGKVYLEFGSIEEARAVLLVLKGRSFNGRIVDIKFYPEDKFRSLNYSHESQGIIITQSYGPVFKEQVYNAAALTKIWEANPQAQS